MSRARRWYAVVACLAVFSGCASSANPGGETSGAEEALWTVFYLVVFVLGVIGAKRLVESHRKN